MEDAVASGQQRLSVANRAARAATAQVLYSHVLRAMYSTLRTPSELMCIHRRVVLVIHVACLLCRGCFTSLVSYHTVIGGSKGAFIGGAHDNNKVTTT